MLSQEAECLGFTWAESPHATLPGCLFWKRPSWAAFLCVTWRVCTQLYSSAVLITICFAWNLSLQVGRMSSYADICGSKHAQGSTEGGYQRYGVRSYLHQFYEDCTASIWEYEDDFQIQRSPSRWSSTFWKVLPIAVYWTQKCPFWDFPMQLMGIGIIQKGLLLLRWQNRQAGCSYQDRLASEVVLGSLDAVVSLSQGAMPLKHQSCVGNPTYSLKV